MMRLLLGMLMMALLMAGCASQEEAPPAPAVEEPAEEPEEPIAEEPPGEEEEDVPGIIEVPDKEEIIEDKKTGPPATSQNDCSTLSPNCETCVAQPGCGWCKSRNGCFFGDASGPAPGIADCPSAEWAYDEQACQGSKGGITCEENWNCADCLSGSGCKWCIQGSICTDIASTEECFGDWMTESYQCNYASR